MSTIESRLAFACNYLKTEVEQYYKRHKLPLVWSSIVLSTMRRLDRPDVKSDEVLAYALKHEFVSMYLSRRRAKCLLPNWIVEGSPAYVQALYDYDNRVKDLPHVRKGNQERQRKSRIKAARGVLSKRNHMHLRQLELLEAGIQKLARQLDTYKSWTLANLKTNRAPDLSLLTGKTSNEESTEERNSSNEGHP